MGSDHCPVYLQLNLSPSKQEERKAEQEKEKDDAEGPTEAEENPTLSSSIKTED
jgi:hypothetical protein